MTALQSIIKEAKSLRTKFPKRFQKWTDYVKQASAIYAAKNKSKSLVGKKKVVKKKAAKKSIAKKPTEKVIFKKVHSAKATSKKLFNKLDNLDEAQHKHMMGALPIGFKGSVLGVNFKVINQFDIYNNVAAIIEDIKNGSTITIIDGTSNIKNKIDQFSSYIKNHTTFNLNDFPKDLNLRITKFVTNLNKEVKEYNLGKKSTTKKKPLIIKKSPKKIVKSKNTLTKVKEVLKQDKKRLKHGYSLTSGNVRLGAVNLNIIDDYKKTCQNIKELENILLGFENSLKQYPNAPKILKDATRKYIKTYKILIKEKKIHARELKKLI